MQFMIEIRHIETGLAKTFASMQEIADFLVGKVEAEWEGFRQLGPLPAPTVSEDVAVITTEPSVEGSAPVTVESGTGADTVVGTEGGAAPSDDDGTVPAAAVPEGATNAGSVETEAPEGQLDPATPAQG